MPEYFSWLDGLEEFDPFARQRNERDWHYRVLADLDFEPIIECPHDIVPHKADLIVEHSCGCREFWCEWMFLTMMDFYDRMDHPCPFCLRMSWVMSGRRI